MLDRGNRWQRDMPKVIWHDTVRSAGFETQHFFACLPFLSSILPFCPSLTLSIFHSFFHTSLISLSHFLFFFPNPLSLFPLLALFPFLCLSPPPHLNVGHKASCTGCCLSLPKHTAPQTLLTTHTHTHFIEQPFFSFPFPFFSHILNWSHISHVACKNLPRYLCLPESCPKRACQQRCRKNPNEV